MFPCRWCLKINLQNRRCQRCQAVYYCNKDCQKQDWSKQGLFGHPHKKQCWTDALNESSHAEEALFGPSVSKEYSQAYPKDKAHVKLLRQQEVVYNCFAVIYKTPNLFEHEGVGQPETFHKRWNSSQYSEEERRTIWEKCHGDIGAIGHTFPSRRNMYGGMMVLRNHTPQLLRYRFGHTYVAVGFVDLLQLMLGDFVEEEESSRGAEGQIKYVGYDLAAPQLGRGHIIYQMMKEGAPSSSILQVWFSTALSRQANEDLIKACSKLIKEETVKESEPMKLLENLVKKKGVPLKDVLQLWKADDNDFIFLTALARPVDRVAMARYLCTGSAFVPDEDSKCGNPTFMPALTRKHEAISLFLSLRNGFLAEYQGSLMDTIQSFLTAKIERLSELIRSDRVSCTFIQKNFTMKDASLASEISKMNPSAIDWSNLCDYFKYEDVFRFAASCSGPDTIHTMHTMNWPDLVCGASVVDYAYLKDYDVDQMLRVARRTLYNERRAEFEQKPYLKRFLKPNAIVNYNMDAIDTVLSLYFGRTHSNLLSSIVTSVAKDLGKPCSFRRNNIDSLNEVVMHNNSAFDFAFAFKGTDFRDVLVSD